MDHFARSQGGRRLGSVSLIVDRATRCACQFPKLARVTDVRGFGGPGGFHYRLGIRRPRPAFSVGIGGKGPKVSPGSGRELAFKATRIEGYDGPVRIEIDGLPPGFTFHGPIEIEAGRNLPHGAFIDNIGLNGLLIVEGQNERAFFITAAPKTPPGRRLFHPRTGADGGQVSLPAWLTVLPAR